MVEAWGTPWPISCHDAMGLKEAVQGWGTQVLGWLRFESSGGPPAEDVNCGGSRFPTLDEETVKDGAPRFWVGLGLKGLGGLPADSVYLKASIADNMFQW